MIPWTVACQAPLSVEFSRQEYWRGLPFPSPGDLPDPGIKQGLLHLPFEPPCNPGDLTRTQSIRLSCTLGKVQSWTLPPPPGPTTTAWKGEKQPGSSCSGNRAMPRGCTHRGPSWTRAKGIKALCCDWQVAKPSPGEERERGWWSITVLVILNTQKHPGARGAFSG